MSLGDGREDAKLCRVADFIGLQRTDSTPQILGRKFAGYKYCVGERPAFFPRIELRNLCVNRLDIRTAEQPRENVSKDLHTGMMGVQIAPDGAFVVVAIEKLGYRDNLSIRGRSKASLQSFALVEIHPKPHAGRPHI
jgi:hypothetical protein